MSSKQPPAAKRGRARRGTPNPTDPRPSESPALSPEARWLRIAIAAFYRAEARGFAPGGELEDWLEAEREIDALGASERPMQGWQPSAAASAKRSAAAAGPPRKRAASKRRTARGADIDTRNREEES
jgi:hypothetical protein